MFFCKPHANTNTLSQVFCLDEKFTFLFYAMHTGILAIAVFRYYFRNSRIRDIFTCCDERYDSEIIYHRVRI